MLWKPLVGNLEVPPRPVGELGQESLERDKAEPQVEAPIEEEEERTGAPRPVIPPRRVHPQQVPGHRVHSTTTGVYTAVQ